METLGIDIGGSGIKAAVVDTSSGEFITERHRIPTPQPCKLPAFQDALKAMLEHFDWTGPVGVGFPGVVRQNRTLSAANLDPTVVDIDLGEILKDFGAFEVAAINDADAAGLAEMQLGAGKNALGTTLMVTVGTGIGTALFNKGVLVPNMELGHIEFKGNSAERLVSERARETRDLSWKEWGKNFNEFLKYITFLLQLDLIILGGGGVKKREKFEKHLTVETPIEYAEFANRAGILGAALAVNAR
ncbi:MAG: ROK family protein [Opitutales bacterium]|nr:ROK family protein [Opitutales bacterium]NRA28070.1 ROK family protein [Opitutales bacterium]